MFAFYDSEFAPATLYNLDDDYIQFSDMNSVLSDFPKDFIKIMLSSNGSYIEYIQSPSVDLQLAAVSKSAWNIRFITNPAPLVQWAAFKDEPESISLVMPESCRLPELVEKYKEIKAEEEADLWDEDEA